MVFFNGCIEQLKHHHWSLGLTTIVVVVVVVLMLVVPYSLFMVGATVRSNPPFPTLCKPFCFILLNNQITIHSQGVVGERGGDRQRGSLQRCRWQDTLGRQVSGTAGGERELQQLHVANVTTTSLF